MAKGGRTHYGEAIGILILDTKFPRIPGDIGNASTFDFPVRLRVVKGASVDRVVRQADPDLLNPFIQAARELESEGVKAITTSCGFLVLFQDELARAVGIPLFTSNLLVVPLVYELTGKRVGIITASSESLTERHLRAAHIDPSIPIAVAGLEGQPEFGRAILGNSDSMDIDKVEGEVVDVAITLAKNHRDLGSFVLECHNLAPYSAAIQEALELPVFDIVTFTRFIYEAVVKRRFTGFM
ncbi:MAG: aspartate/glutamate racemase family protein [Candidatus Geothermarchaeales archaeon]